MARIEDRETLSYDLLTRLRAVSRFAQAATFSRRPRPVVHATMASSALAAACLRHQRTVFLASVAAGAAFSFATGQSALDALPTPRGAAPTAGAAAPAAAAVARTSAGKSLQLPRAPVALTQPRRWR